MRDPLATGRGGSFHTSVRHSLRPGVKAGLSPTVGSFAGGSIIPKHPCPDCHWSQPSTGPSGRCLGSASGRTVSFCLVLPGTLQTSNEGSC